MTNLLFGECLKLLLSSLDISNNRLSKAINVDCSLVNRWIHGKRVPPYNSNYIESISEYLSHNVYNTIHEQHINSIFLKAFADIEMASDIKKKIEMVLLEAQGHSIELSKKKKQEIKIQSLNNNQITNIPANNPLNTLKQSVSPYTELSNEDKVLFGQDTITTASFQLLERAANQKCRENNIIYITYSYFIYAESASYLIKWRKILLKAISNGWNINLLLKMKTNANRSVSIMNYMIPLVRTGKFIPYYVKNYDSIITGDELVVVPDIGVLSCFSTDLQSGINCGLYFNNKSAIQLYQSHFHAYIAKYAQPLMKIFTDRTDYSHYLADSEDNIGNRFLYRYCFSVLTLPEHLYGKFIEKKKLSADAKNLAVTFYRKRLNAFLTNIQNYEYRDVYMAASIKDLMKTHQFQLYSYAGIVSMHMDTLDIIEYLENIIFLLQRYKNYKIAFLPEDYNNTENMEHFCCVVKDRITVLFESNNEAPNTQEIHIAITEPTFVKSINDHFIDLWEHIAPVYKEKSEVISWLKYQISILKQSPL